VDRTTAASIITSFNSDVTPVAAGIMLEPDQ
jgi:hypothetical protein